MTIPAETVRRYQPGGDIYTSLAEQYGDNGALLVAQAALTGTDLVDIGNAITRVKFGERLDDSTASNFLRQITTDPLGAPLASANGIFGNAFRGLFKSPWVLLALALALFFMVGGFDLVKRKVATA